MIVFRAMRAAARLALGLLTLAPALALLAAAFFDQGPSGAARASVFPIALRACDPFVWTCVRNSLIFASALAAGALVLGVGLGWLASRAGRGPWSATGLLRAAAGPLLVAPPFAMALGLVGIWGAARPWPWPLETGGATFGSAGAGVSLESWRGVPLWLIWIWSALPGAAVLVARETAAAVDRLQPAWEDAARLAGAGRARTWRVLLWPLVRPRAARAAGLVFVLALVEPGAPIILGLRRTLAFQIVDLARRPGPFPGLAIWGGFAGLLAFGGWSAIHLWGTQGKRSGPVRNDRRETAAERGAFPFGPAETGRSPAVLDGPVARLAPGRTGPIASVLAACVLAAALALGWLPVWGLIRPWRAAGCPFFQGLPVPGQLLLCNSLGLGAIVAASALLAAWLVRPFARDRARSRGLPTPLGVRLFHAAAWMPPLLQGVGVLAVPWLAGLAARATANGASSPTMPRGASAHKVLSWVAVELDPDRAPWILLVIAVGLSVGVRRLRWWSDAAAAEGPALRAGVDAALLAGVAPWRARTIAAWRPSRWIGRALMVAGRAATCLVPALLFVPWWDGQTLAPAVIEQLDGPENGAPGQAAALALVVLGVNLAGWAATARSRRASRSTEADVELEPWPA